MHLKLTLLLISNLFFIQLSFSNLLVEPHFSKINGKVENSEEKNSFEGYNQGIRIGYVGDTFLIGISATIGNANFVKPFEDTQTDRFRYGGLGSFLGFRHEHIKLWVGYLNSSLEATDDPDGRYFGQHLSYGVGVNLFMHVFLNAEYFANYFTQYEDDESGKTDALEDNIKTSGAYLSLSFLFEF